MPFNPSPRIADAANLAAKWKKEQVIIIAIDGEGDCETITYGRDRQLCRCACALGKVAFEAMRTYVRRAEAGALGGGVLEATQARVRRLESNRASPTSLPSQEPPP